MSDLKSLKYPLAALILTALAPHAAAEVGSGPQMVGTFGTPKARTRIAAGKRPDDYVVSLQRGGSSCSGELAGPARAYTSNVVTLSEKDRSSGTTCTVDLIYGPDFSAVAVRESAACLSFHGAACNFEGSFKRQR